MIRVTHHLNHSRLPLLMLVVTLLCLLAYSRGLFGSFVFDDFGNVVDNPAMRALNGTSLRWLALAVSSHSGVLRRPISMLSFGLDYSMFGYSPLAFKLTNLVIHLLNGALVYALGRRLVEHLMPPNSVAASRTRQEYLALFAATLWLLHPLNVSGVVYVVQRMNELTALFSLMGLLCYVEGRERMLRGGSGLLIALAGLCTFGLLAVFSKENGAMIFAYALVIEGTCYRFATPNATQKRALKGFFLLTFALPIALFLVYIATHPQWLLEGYAGRSFTLPQRLLSEARVLCTYLLWIFVPYPSWMGIFHDDIATSTALFSPATTAPAIFFLLALMATAWRLRHRSPGFAFAVAWFLVGHAMESTIIPLELIFEHRNYLPMAGLLLGCVCALGPLLISRVSTVGIMTTCSALALILAGLTAVRSNDWGGQLRLALAEVKHHPHSPRAQYEAGRAIIFDGTAKGRQKAAEDEAVPYFERGKSLDSTDVYTASSLILIRGGRGINVDADIVDLATRIRSLKQAQINPFLVIMTAATERKLPITSSQMELLIGSALDNPHFPATVRAMILSNYGHYQFQVMHDNQAAITLTLAAAAEDPQNPLFQINLTKLALVLGESQQAAEHLQIADRLNKAGIYDETISGLKRQLPQISH